MRKSLGTACAASAVAVFVGWAFVAGNAGPRQAQANLPQFFQPGIHQPAGVGTTMPGMGPQWGGGSVQYGPFESMGMGGPQTFQQQPGMMGAYQPPGLGVQQSMLQLELSAQQLRNAIQALAQQPPSERRDFALQSSYRALAVTNEALVNLAPRLAEAQFAVPPHFGATHSPWTTHWQQQHFYAPPAAMQYGFAPQPQHFAYFGSMPPGMMAHAQPMWTPQPTWDQARTRAPEPIAFEAVGDQRDGLLGVEPQRLRNTVSAERLLEAEVRGLGGRSVGSIESIVLANGKVSALVVRGAGLLGTGSERYRVPWAQLRVSPTADYVYMPLTSRAEAEKYRKAAEGAPQTGEWRLADLLDDGVNLKDGTHYGRVGDVLISQQGELVGVVVRPGRRAPGAQLVVAYDAKVFARDADAHTIPYEREQLAKLQSFNYISLALVGPAAYMGTRAERLAVLQPAAPAAAAPKPPATAVTPPEVQLKPAETPAKPADPQATAPAPQPASAAAAAEVKPVLPEPPKPAEPAAKPVEAPKPAEAAAKPAEPRL